MGHEKCSSVGVSIGKILHKKLLQGIISVTNLLLSHTCPNLLQIRFACLQGLPPNDRIGFGVLAPRQTNDAHRDAPHFLEHKIAFALELWLIFCFHFSIS